MLSLGRRFPVSLNKIVIALCGFMGAALQIQASVGASYNYSGLRLNFGDFVLPFAGLAVLMSLLFKRSVWPRWRIPFGTAWPALMTVVMTLSLFIGYYDSHELNDWALINKYAGWIVLTAYLFLGAWVVTNAGERPVRIFLQTLFITFAVILTGSMAVLILQDIKGSLDLLTSERQLMGLIGNRNVYALFMLSMMGIAAACQMSEKNLLPDWLLRAFWGVLPVALVYNASRSGWLTATFVLICIAIVFKKKVFKPILAPLTVGLIFIAGLWSINSSWVLRENQILTTNFLVESAQKDQLNYEGYKETAQMLTGDFIRLRVFQDSMNLWEKSPFMGIGLGSFLKFQTKTYGLNSRGLDIIDSTPLWLLTETGLVGFFIFGGFFIVALLALWRGSRKLETETDILRMTLFLTLIGFSFMMVFHELMYTRYIWFALGLALAQTDQKKT